MRVIWTLIITCMIAALCGCQQASLSEDRAAHSLAAMWREMPDREELTYGEVLLHNTIPRCLAEGDDEDRVALMTLHETGMPSSNKNLLHWRWQAIIENPDLLAVLFESQDEQAVRSEVELLSDPQREELKAVLTELDNQSVIRVREWLRVSSVTTRTL